MGKFTVIPQDTFEGMQLDAGVLLTKFDPATGNFENKDIVCATTGGITVTCKPTYSDMGEDVDNCPVGMKELMHLDSWETSISTTSLGTSPESIRMALGAADVNAENGKITPRRDLKQSDFGDVWWVGDRADGGMVAARLMNALSTEGFSLQTTKNGKGQTAITLSGHVSLAAQDVVPMEFYSAGPATYTITVDGSIENGSVAVSVGGQAATKAKKGDSVKVTATPAQDYVLDHITVTDSGSKAVPVDGSGVFTMPDSAVTVTAAFRAEG